MMHPTPAAILNLVHREQQPPRRADDILRAERLIDLAGLEADLLGIGRKAQEPRHEHKAR